MSVHNVNTDAERDARYAVWEVFHNAYSSAIRIGHRGLASAVAVEANKAGFHFDENPTMIDNPRFVHIVNSVVTPDGYRLQRQPDGTYTDGDLVFGELLYDGLPGGAE